MKYYITFLVIIVFVVSSNTVISEEIFNISISPDGTKAVVYKQLGIEIVDLNTQEIITFIPDKNYIDSIWSPNSDYLGIIMKGASIEIWNVSDAVLVATLIGHPQGSSINAFEWYENQLYSMTFEGSLLVWDMTTYQYTHTFSIGGNDLRISPTGDKLAIASFFNIAILDLNNMTLESFAQQVNQILSVAWSPDGQKIASSAVDGKIQIWNLNDTINPERVIVANNVSHELSWVTELRWNNGYLAVRQMYNDSVAILDDETGTLLDTILVENGRFIWSGNTGYYATFQNEPIQFHQYCDEITQPDNILNISQEIVAGNSNAFGNTICLSPNATYTLTTPLPTITGDITLIGNGAEIVMMGTGRVFDVAETGSLTLKNITVSDN